MKPSHWTEETLAVPRRKADTASETWASAAIVITSSSEVKQKCEF
jgi:hypothetical protein